MAYQTIFREGLFAGRVIVVTGGGSGIGRCTAHEGVMPVAADNTAVIPGLVRLVPGIQPSAATGASGKMDPGHKARDDS